MYRRSPQQLRSGTKGKPVALSTDKRVPSLSAPPASRPATAPATGSATRPTSSTSTTTTTMPPVDTAVVEQCLTKLLSGGTVLDSLVERLTVELKKVVEVAVASAMTQVQQDLQDLRRDVTSLTARLSALEEKVTDRTDDLEQYQRRTNLRVFGVAETNGEDTDQLVVDLCRDKLGLDISVAEVCRSHRVGRTPQPAADGRPRHRPIIVRFVSYRSRRLVFQAKKKLKGTGVTVREDLTKRRLEVFTRAAERHGLTNTWTQDGRVMWIDAGGRRGSATRLADLERSAGGD